MVAPERIETAAVPFILGVAVGLAIGRVVLDSIVFGAVIGLVLFGLLLWLRDRLVASA